METNLAARMIAVFIELTTQSNDPLFVLSIYPLPLPMHVLVGLPTASGVDVAANLEPPLPRQQEEEGTTESRPLAYGYGYERWVVPVGRAAQAIVLLFAMLSIGFCSCFRIVPNRALFSSAVAAPAALVLGSNVGPKSSSLRCPPARALALAIRPSPRAMATDKTHLI